MSSTPTIDPVNGGFAEFVSATAYIYTGSGYVTIDLTTYEGSEDITAHIPVGAQHTIKVDISHPSEEAAPTVYLITNCPDNITEIECP